jgi:hypothetical protein
VCHDVACFVGLAGPEHQRFLEGTPASCSESGRPVDENPHGSASAGWPVMLNGGMLLRGKPNSGSVAIAYGVGRLRRGGGGEQIHVLHYGRPPRQQISERIRCACMYSAAGHQGAAEQPLARQHVAVELRVLAQVALVIRPSPRPA